MRQRAPFVLHGNFQGYFLLALTLLVGAGLGAGALIHYRVLDHLLQAAAFSAHFTRSSSGELLWRAIVNVSCVTALVSMALSGVTILCGLFYLERLFGALVVGIAHLAQGDVTFRVTLRGWWWGRSLLQAFNSAAERLDHDAQTLRAQLSACAEAAASGQREALPHLAALQQQLQRMSRP